MPNDHLVTLRRRVDAHFADAVERDPDAFRCASGCAQCCHRRFDVFEVEAQPIRAALVVMAREDPALRQTVRDQARAPEHAHHCALLVQDRCSVYEQRPLICRSHGLPVAVPEEDELHVSWCELNYPGGDPPRESILLVEAINAPLAVLTELDAPAAPRVSLADLAGSV